MLFPEIVSLCSSIRPLDEQAMLKARHRWLQLCKPLLSLGSLEDLVTQLAGIQGNDRPIVRRKAIAIFAADNGVVCQGVTQCGQEITAQVTFNFTRGIATINAFARVAGVDIFPVDVGINQEGRIPGVLDRRIRQGTADLSTGPAMQRTETLQAIQIGYDQAAWLKNQGYDLVGAGEMGIGNTTTSSAVLSVLLGVEPKDVTGRGAGLTDDQLIRKIAVIEQGIRINTPDSNDPIDVLQKVGGLDLASMAGFYLGCAANRLPAVIDGFIASVAALVAVKLCPAVRDYLFASHQSAEQAGERVLNELNLQAYLHCGLRLGEGTGCCVAFGLFDHAVTAFREVATFEQAGVDAYDPRSSMLTR